VHLGISVLAQSETQQIADKSHFTLLEAELRNESLAELALFLTTHNLSHAVNFATRIQNNWSTAIYNIFVDNCRTNLSSTSPITDGLSDHDAQIFTLKYINATMNKSPLKQRTRLIADETGG
jgi:hypothetical protein